MSTWAACVSEQPQGRGVGTQPAGRVRDRHRLGAVPQVVGRLGVGSSLTGYEPMGGVIVDF